MKIDIETLSRVHSSITEISAMQMNPQMNLNMSEFLISVEDAMKILEKTRVSIVAKAWEKDKKLEDGSLSEEIPPMLDMAISKMSAETAKDLLIDLNELGESTLTVDDPTFTKEDLLQTNGGMPKTFMPLLRVLKQFSK